jgi:alkylation response protein AidB-like acyl-CoA dehydrogenase
MNFDLSEEQELFTSTVERFTAPIDVEARRGIRKQDGGYDRARWQELAELGLIAMAASEDDGGLGSSPLDLALVGEAIGKANALDPWLENGILPALLLSKAGASEPLAEVISGETIVSLAWAERARRFNLEPATTVFTSGASGDATGSLSGEKTFVLGAGIADSFIVTALEGDTTVAFLIPANREGVSVRKYVLADGSLAGELRLNRVAVMAEDKLSLSLSQIEAAASDMRLYCAAELLGLGQRLLSDTLTYVKEREQFGVPIGSFQALQHRLVDCYAAIEQSRSMLLRTAMNDSNDTDERSRAAAGAKAYVTEQVDHVAREAVQMHGGMGVTDELAIGHAMKRVMVLAQLFGDVDMVLGTYARAA